MGFVLNYNGEIGNTYSYPKIENQQNYIAILGVSKGNGPSKNIKVPKQGDVIFTYPKHQAFLIRDDGIEDFAIVTEKGKVYYEPLLSPLFLSEQSFQNGFSSKMCKWPLEGQSFLVYITPDNVPNRIEVEFNEKFHGSTIKFRLEATGTLKDTISFVDSLRCLKLKTLESFQYSKFIRLWIKYSIGKIILNEKNNLNYEKEWSLEIMTEMVKSFLAASGFHTNKIIIENYSVESDAVVIDGIEDVLEIEDVEVIETMQEGTMNEGSTVELQQDESWVCEQCGHTLNTGKFCKACGSPKKEERPHWECLNCGTVNNRNYCYKCGRKKPIQIQNYRCAKCGWTPDKDETFEPIYCPECGDKIEEEDIFYTLE